MKTCRPTAALFAVVSVLSTLAPANAPAQVAGRVDPAFRATLGVPGQVSGILRQADGKLLVTGGFSRVHGVPRPGTARLFPDGRLDPGFDSVIPSDYLHTAALLSDGGILVGGTAGLYPGGLDLPALVRLDPAGRLDPGFRVPANVGAVYRIAVRGDGGILADAALTDGTYRLLRLNASGSLNAILATNTGRPTDFLNLLALQPDGRILFQNDSDDLARLNADGSPDAAFRPNLGANVDFLGLETLLPDGRLLVRGYDTVGSTELKVRLNPDGSLDGGFRSDLIAGISFNSGPVAVQPGGRIVFGGQESGLPPGGFLRRLNPDGRRDAGFDVTLAPGPTLNDSEGVSGTADTLLAQPDGRVLVGGTFSYVNGALRPGLAALGPDGALDPAFDAGLEASLTTDSSRSVPAILALPDGRLLVGGAFNVASGLPRNGIARLNADGTADPGFDPGTGADGRVNAIARQPDGHLLVGGAFRTFNGQPHRGLVRLDAGGGVDPAFRADILTGPDTAGPDQIVRALLPQADGKVLAAGYFVEAGGSPRPGLVRFNADGSLDAGFQAGPGTGTLPAVGYVNALAALPDGSVLVGGFFDRFNGAPRNSLARLDANGQLVDAGYRPPASTAWTCLAAQADGKVVVGGVGPYGAPKVGTVNYSRPTVFRLNADGELDPTFNAAAVIGGTLDQERLTNLVVRPDGTIELATDLRVLRLNADGGLAESFTLQEPDRYSVDALAVTPDNRVIAGGQFTPADQFYAVGGLVRLVDDVPPAPAFFNGSVDVGGGFSYLPEFGYYKRLLEAGYVFHNDLGFLYYIDANDGKGGIYFYDFATPSGAKSLGFLYTSPSLFPFLYSFGLNTFVYYFPDAKRGPGFYTTTPRTFSRLDTGEVLFR